MALNSKYLFRVKLNIPSIVLGIFSFGLIAISNLTIFAKANHKYQFISPPPNVERFSFGYSEAMADSLWIRAIQDFDYCENKLAENLCEGNGWLFQMLDTITNLSPKFRIPYSSGALALTIIISDYEGAKKIFDKGVKAFPNDWPILYRAGYHYLYEVGDKTEAANLFKRAADNGAPSWLYSLAGRLYSDSGQVVVAEQLLQEMINTEKDPAIIERLRQKIQSMKKNAQ